MSSYGSDLDNQPLRYYNGKPIYLTLYLVLAMAAGIVVTTLLQSAMSMGALYALAFTPQVFLRGFVWQPLTYVFVEQISFFTPLALIMFYLWGVEVEKFLGRKHLLALIGALILLPTLLSLVLEAFGAGQTLSGNYLLVIGLLIAFATLYPDLDYLGGWIPLKWFAFACVVCGALMYFPQRAWGQLFIMLANCGAAYALVRYTRGELKWNFNFRAWLPQKKPKLRVLPNPAPSVRAGRPSAAAPSATRPVTGPEEEMDALLDKIARSGLASLSAAEKTRLEKLRQQLLGKGH